MAHPQHIRRPSTSTSFAHYQRTTTLTSHTGPLPSSSTTLRLTFTSSDPYNTTLISSSPSTGISQSHSPSALSFSSSALADTPTPLPIQNGNGNEPDEEHVWDGQARVGDTISIRVESPISESSALGASSRSSGSGSSASPSRIHPHLTTAITGSGIMSASGSLMFAPAARGGPGLGEGGGSRTNTPGLRLGQRPRSSSGERSGGTSEIERPEPLYVISSATMNQTPEGQRYRRERQPTETVIHGGGPAGEVVAKIVWRRFRSPEVILLGPSMPHGVAKVTVEGWMTRVGRTVVRRARMWPWTTSRRASGGVSGVSEGSGGSSRRRVHVSKNSRFRIRKSAYRG